MMLPEEEAENELSKRLRQKLEDYKAPVKDQVRVNVFAALDKNTRRFFWIPIAAALLLVGGILGGYLYSNREMGSKRGIAIHKNEIKAERKSYPTSSSSKRDDLIQQNTNQKKEVEVYSKDVTKNQRQQKINSSKRETIENIDSFTFDKIETNTANISPLLSIDSIQSSINLHSPEIKINALTVIDNASPRPKLMHGVSGVFSAAFLQSFQQVNLSQSMAGRIQNFEFAPLFSSKSLSYKFTAGIEKKNTQILLNYTYLRSWNEYEVRTNQVVATQVGEHQYSMHRLGEKHIEDDRLHLLGIGIHRRFTVMPGVLQNYTLSLGAEYNRVLPTGQNLVWGNLGFFRQIHQSPGSRIEVGPYLQYSFTDREVAGQAWKSRPYQVGISMQLKVK